jgi:hypothetical protein
MANDQVNEGFFKNLGRGFQAAQNQKLDNTKLQQQNNAVTQGMEMLKQKFDAGKKGFNLQRQYSNMDKLKQELKQLVDDGVISPRQTVNQLINWNVPSFQNKKMGAKGFGGAKNDYQRQAKQMGIKLSEAIDKEIDKFLKK